MNQKWKLGVIFLPPLLTALWSASAKLNGVAQQTEPDYKNNNCVSCHSRLLEPLHLGNLYLEWQFSKHREKGAGCEKCHGGDPSAMDKRKAHEGVSPASDQRSRLYWKNQPGTCGACHQNVVSVFVESAHYKRLNGISLGMSCNTCHAHMATLAPHTPAETSNLCSQCHDSVSSLNPSPEIPERAKETMMALQRADSMIIWAKMLLDNGRRLNLSLDEEANEIKTAENWLREARVNWHTLDLDAVRKQADEAFLKGAKVRDGMRKRLGAE